MPALFSWGDVNGDGRLDLAAVSGDGRLQLLVNAGDGRFEDVTERVGITDVGNAALALWADYDGDGRLDLFVGAREGASRLFHNADGVFFVDISSGSGLSSAGAVQSAQWLDHDGDGRLDLFVVTAQKNELFRGIEGGFFEVSELPLAVSTRTPSAHAAPMDSRGVPSPPAMTRVEGTARELSGPDRERDGQLTPASAEAMPRASARSRTVAAGITAGPHSLATATNCFPAITDQGLPANCLQGSSTPTLGMLYPISANLFVATSGNVGIGTTSPAAKLDVAGTARMTGTLTLKPSVDQALDVSTGSIYKDGKLFIHTKGGAGNSALGGEALASVTTGSGNTASGYRALHSNTTGALNTASGGRALYSNTTGSRNTASGHQALYSNTTGRYNTASGYRALFYNWPFAGFMRPT